MNEIFDSHVHISRSYAPWLGDDAVSDQIETARRCGIDRMMISSLGDTDYIAYPTPEEFRAANDHILEAVGRFPETFFGLCYVSPEHPHASVDEIRRCVEDGPLVGIKLWISRKASDAAVDPILREAARLGIPVLQHAWYKTTGNLPDESTPADVAEMARRHPDVRIQMAHLNGVRERGVQDIADCPNVYIDTSGGEPESALIEYAVQTIGAERIVFGSDAPIRDFAVQLGKVLGANLLRDQYEGILWKNIERILGIGNRGEERS